MRTLAFQGLVGLSLAMYLWLISAGLTISFGVLGVINFAHGSLFMLGAYFAFTFYGLLGWNFFAAIALSLLATAGVGWVMERFFLRYLYGVDEAYQLLLTFGFVLILDDGGLDLAAALGRVRIEASGAHRFLEMREDAFDFFDHRR